MYIKIFDYLFSIQEIERVKVQPLLSETLS